MGPPPEALEMGISSSPPKRLDWEIEAEEKLFAQGFSPRRGDKFSFSDEKRKKSLALLRSSQRA